MLNLCAVALVDAGIASTFVGLVSMVKPLRFIGIRSRGMAAAVAGISFVLILTGMLLPAPMQHATTRRTDLDRVMPAWQFNEHHAISIRASPDRIYRAIKDTTAGEILFFQTLVWIRRFGRSGPESVLNAPERRPLLDVATDTTFTTLTDTVQEIVVGTPVVAPRSDALRRKPSADEFLTLRDRPGFALATMNFAIGDCTGGACAVTTETRVFATDARTTHAFAAYWRIIYPGSALIRRMWLRAIARRAEAHIE